MRHATSALLRRADAPPHRDAITETLADRVNVLTRALVHLHQAATLRHEQHPDCGADCFVCSVAHEALAAIAGDQ